MGYFHDEHIQLFTLGHIVDEIQIDGDKVWLMFPNGESLLLQPTTDCEGKPAILTTPYGADSKIVQSTEIMKRFEGSKPCQETT